MKKIISFTLALFLFVLVPFSNYAEAEVIDFSSWTGALTDGSSALKAATDSGSDAFTVITGGAAAGSVAGAGEGITAALATPVVAGAAIAAALGIGVYEGTQVPIIQDICNGLGDYLESTGKLIAGKVPVWVKAGKTYIQKDLIDDIKTWMFANKYFESRTSTGINLDSSIPYGTTSLTFNGVTEPAKYYYYNKVSRTDGITFLNNVCQNSLYQSVYDHYKPQIDGNLYNIVGAGVSIFNDTSGSNGSYIEYNFYFYHGNFAKGCFVISDDFIGLSFDGSLVGSFRYYRRVYNDGRADVFNYDYDPSILGFNATSSNHVTYKLYNTIFGSPEDIVKGVPGITQSNNPAKENEDVTVTFPDEWGSGKSINVPAPDADTGTVVDPANISQTPALPVELPEPTTIQQQIQDINNYQTNYRAGDTETTIVNNYNQNFQTYYNSLVNPGTDPDPGTTPSDLSGIITILKQILTAIQSIPANVVKSFGIGTMPESKPETAVADAQTQATNLVQWAFSYLNPKIPEGLFSKFPFSVPYDMYLILTGVMGSSTANSVQKVSLMSTALAAESDSSDPVTTDPSSVGISIDYDFVPSTYTDYSDEYAPVIAFNLDLTSTGSKSLKVDTTLDFHKFTWFFKLTKMAIAIEWLIMLLNHVMNNGKKEGK